MSNIIVRLKREWQKYKELLLYILFGGLTTILNYILYYIISRSFNIETLLSNALVWFICLLFSFFTNKYCVFKSTTPNAAGICKEFIVFSGSRVFSVLLDMTILWIGVYVFNFNDLIVKASSNLVVIVINYIASKYFVFASKLK